MVSRRIGDSLWAGCSGLPSRGGPTYLGYGGIRYQSARDHGIQLWCWPATMAVGALIQCFGPLYRPNCIPHQISVGGAPLINRATPTNPEDAARPARRLPWPPPNGDAPRLALCRFALRSRHRRGRSLG